MIEVVYRFPPGVDADRHAKMIAVGQTAGTWGAAFAHREARLRAHLGEVLAVARLPDGGAEARIRFPTGNVEGDLGTLLTMIFGKYSLAGAARVTELALPAGYGTAPKFGIPGLRERLGVYDRPLFMGIFKPALGLTAQDHAELLAPVAEAGLDLIKDDEILPDLPSAPTLERVGACREVLDRAAAKRGRPMLYAVNVTGRADRIIDRARQLVEHGASALLLNVLSVGYPVLEALAADPRVAVPIFAHPALAGAWGGPGDGSGAFGIDYAVSLGTLMRHGGADAVLYPAHYGSLPFDAATEARIRDLLRSPDGAGPPVMPVPSAGIHPGVVGRALADYGNDVVLNAGSAIFDHPDGPAAGVQAFFDAHDRVRAGAPLTAEAVPAGPLRTALETWGTGENKR